MTGDLYLGADGHLRIIASEVEKTLIRIFIVFSGKNPKPFLANEFDGSSLNSEWLTKIVEMNDDDW